MTKKILVALAALVLIVYLSSAINALLSYRIDRWAGVNAGNYYEYSGVINIHTDFSDGWTTYSRIEKMCDSLSLHFAIITDLNTVKPMQDSLAGRFGVTLIVPAVEVSSTSDPERFLVIGDSVPLVPGKTVTADSVVQNAITRKDIVIMAQPVPHDGTSDFDAAPLTHITGMEIYNFNQSWPSTFNVFLINKFLGAYSIYGFEEKALNYLLSYPTREMKVFDELNTRRKVVGLGSVGATDRIKLGRRFYWHFPRYESLLTLIHTVIVTREPFNGHYAHDREILLNAIRRGNDFVAFSGLEEARAFLFTASSDTVEAIMGDSLLLRGSANLRVVMPDSEGVVTDIVRNGKVIDSYSDKGEIELTVTTPGEYRIQAFQQRTMLPFFIKRKFPWILSNPIYIFER